MSVSPDMITAMSPGMIFIDRGDKPHALEAFERALAVDPVLHNAAPIIDALKHDLGKGI